MSAYTLRVCQRLNCFITKDTEALFLSRAHTNQKKSPKCEAEFLRPWVSIFFSQHLNTVKQPGNKNKENNPNLHNLAAIMSRNISIILPFLLHISYNASRPLVNKLQSFPWVRILISISAFKLAIIDLSSKNFSYYTYKKETVRTPHSSQKLTIEI